MKKRYGLLVLVILIILIAVITILLIVNPQKKADDYAYNLYFLSSDDGAFGFKAEKHYLNYTSDETIAKALINILISGPKSRDLVSPFPENLRLVSLKKTGNVIYINYSKQYLDLTAFEMNLADYCVIKSLSGISGISRFSFSVEGGPHPISGYKFVSLENFIPDKDSFKIFTKNITLYYPSEDYSSLIARNITFSIHGHEAIEKKVLSMLMYGTEHSNLRLKLPLNTFLYSVSVINNTVNLNFTEEFLEYANEENSMRGKLTIYSIVNSLTELPNINNVKFEVEGKPISVYAGINLDEPLTRNKDFIKLHNYINGESLDLDYNLNTIHR